MLKPTCQELYQQGKIVAKLLPTEVTVCYKPYCVYIFAKKAFEAKLRDGRPKFRNAKIFKAKPKKKQKLPKQSRNGPHYFSTGLVQFKTWHTISPPRLQSKVIPQEEKKRKEAKKKSYSGRLLTASVGRQ